VERARQGSNLLPSDSKSWSIKRQTGVVILFSKDVAEMAD
jgi:hypothetical protein